MIKLGHFRPIPFLALAIACTAGIMGAQDSVQASNRPPVIVGSAQAEKMALVQITPEYPAVAKVNYIEGQVHLMLTVDRNGKVDKARVLDGNALLAESAWRAACTWIYHPLILPSGPSGFMTMVTVKFVLQHWWAAEMPPHPEQYFLNQVKPPHVVRGRKDTQPGNLVHMRLLVNDQGKVVDCGGTPRGKAQFDSVCETLRVWTIRPAHWGSLPIASYLDVQVPVSAPSVTRASADFEGR